MTSQGELLARVVQGLEDFAIPHMVVGSLASSFHGKPRQTRGIDLVIDPDADALRRFVAGLPADEFYSDADAALEALERRTSFNLVEVDSGWKVDLIIRKDRPFSQEELKRRVPVRLLETETYVASAEDTVIAKLEWAREGASERPLRDVAAILDAQGDSLDIGHVGRWVQALHLDDTWLRARGLATR